MAVSRGEPPPLLVGGEEREEPGRGGSDQRHHHLGRGKRMQLGQGDRQGQAAHAADYGLQPEPAAVRADAVVADRIADRVVTGGERMGVINATAWTAVARAATMLKAFITESFWT